MQRYGRNCKLRKVVAPGEEENQYPWPQCSKWVPTAIKWTLKCTAHYADQKVGLFLGSHGSNRLYCSGWLSNSNSYITVLEGQSCVNDSHTPMLPFLGLSISAH